MLRDYLNYRDNIPVGRRSPGRPKRRWSDLIFDQNRWNRLKQRIRKGKMINKNGIRGIIIRSENINESMPP